METICEILGGIPMEGWLAFILAGVALMILRIAEWYESGVKVKD